MMNNFLNGMFGKVGNGMCRLSMSGGIAVKTSNGYKSYNVKTGRLTNCDNFAFDIGQYTDIDARFAAKEKAKELLGIDIKY